MLVNDIDEFTKEQEKMCSELAEVEFVRYDDYDPYCNLCSGLLELRINGESWLFSDTAGEVNVYPGFFCPTVCWANADLEGKKHTEWEVDISLLPEELRPFAKIIDEVVNANMPDCICRGCD